jgi:uncharacterized protein YjbI with pentapeptide repeats
MKLHQVIEALDANDANLSGSAFNDANLSGSKTTDANLSGCVFEDRRLPGMTINGVPVNYLFDAYETMR